MLKQNVYCQKTQQKRRLSIRVNFRDRCVSGRIQEGSIHIASKCLHDCQVVLQNLLDPVNGELVRVNNCGLARKRKRRGALKDIDGSLDVVVGCREKGNGVPLASNVAPRTKVPGGVKNRKLVGAVVGNTLIAHVVRPARVVNVDGEGCSIDQAGAHTRFSQNVGCGLDCIGDCS